MRAFHLYGIFTQALGPKVFSNLTVESIAIEGSIVSSRTINIFYY